MEMKKVITFSVLPVASEECPLAMSYHNSRPLAEVKIGNLRRQQPPVEDVDPALFKFKFGITYPAPLVYTTTSTQWPPLWVTTSQVFTFPPKQPTRNKFDWQNEKTTKSPPTQFFPLGRISAITVTAFPFALMTVDPDIQSNPCEIFLRPCLRAHDTGYICARSYYDNYYTFETYCAMQDLNCKGKAIIWELAYFGNCHVERIPDRGEEFNIEGDNFLEAALINEPPYNPITGTAEGF